ncbi:MAG: type II secretion system GspH family protein [Chlamydiae bacterium]|nr:type II secretion system GspH family protein [Chlamydiota bacterium]
MKKKKTLTLLEVMIVISLILLIGGVIGYNIKGSLDEGRRFKTKHAMEQIADILMYVASRDNISLQEVAEHSREHLEKSGLVKNVDELTKDGWGGEFNVSVKDNAIVVHSKNYIDHLKKKSKKAKVQTGQDEEVSSNAD